MPNSNPRYVIAADAPRGGIIYWQGKPDYDWKWTRTPEDAETYGTLDEAQAKALWIAFTYPRYLGFLEVVRAGGLAESR